MLSQLKSVINSILHIKYCPIKPELENNFLCVLNYELIDNEMDSKLILKKEQQL